MKLPVPDLHDTHVRRLDRTCAPDVQALFERRAAFFILAEGASPDTQAGARELETIIAGRSAAETFCLGVYHEGSLVAFLHLTENYPRQDEWWIGLFLLDPGLRRRGFGTEIHRAVSEWILENGGRRLWLGVLEQNSDAERFWRKLRYAERERQPYTMKSGAESVVILMSLPIISVSRA